MMQMIFSCFASFTRTALLGLLVACNFVAVGCSSEKEPSGNVKGSVSYNGSPLPEGLINIYSQDRSVVGTTEIDSMGHFEFENAIEVGNYRVYISPPPPPAPPEPGGPPVTIPATMKIPQKYRAAKTTDLTITIEKGNNEISIPLVD